MSTPTTGGFDFNRPTIIGLLFLGGYVTVITALIAVVLCYVWRDQEAEAWELTHFTYLANTFWIGVVGSIVGLILALVLIGFLVWFAVGILCLVRVIMSLVAAQKRTPMPNPSTFLI